MSVGRICVRTVWTAEPDESLRAAAQRMAEANVGTIVVLDDERVPVGILTDRDVMLRCVVDGEDADQTKVSEVMTSPISMVREDTPIEEALNVMATCNVRRLPIVDEKNRLVGILAVDDVVELLAEETSTLGRLLAKYT